MTLNFNQAPYYDDFDEDKQFARIVYDSTRRAVQARELTQAQTILQKQIERFGNHIFEDGAMVIPGYINHDLNYNFVKINSTVDLANSSYRETNFVGKIVTGGTSGVKAVVVNHLGVDVNNKITLYVKYVKSGTTGTATTFSAGETLTSNAVGAPTCVVASSSHVGVGSAANIKRGIYFMKGFFLLVKDQTIILDAESNTPSYSVGLKMVESIVDSDEDPSLLSAAQGTPNFAGKGADRYKIEPVLEKHLISELGTTAADGFYELMRIQNGELQKQVVVSDYSELEKTFARRTVEAHGNFTIKPFPLHIKEFYNDGSNGGVYVLSDFEYTTAAEAQEVSVSRFGVADPGTYHVVSGKYRPGSSDPDLIALMDKKLVVEIESGKAYVNGFEISKIAKTSIDLDRSRTYDYANNSSIYTPVGAYIRANNVYGLPSIGTYVLVDLYDAPSYVPGLPSKDKATLSDGLGLGVKIGTARVRGFQYDATANTVDIYKAYLFDIQMLPGKNFYNTKQIYNSTDNFTADIALDQFLLSGTVSGASGAVTTSTTVPTTFYGTQTRWVSDPAQQLLVDDYLLVQDDGGTPRLLRVAATPTTDGTISIAKTAAAYTFTNKTITYVSATLIDNLHNILLFPLPQKYIRMIKSSDDTTVDTNYYVRRVFTGTTNGSGVLNINAGTDEEFLPYSRAAYSVAYTSGGGAGTIATTTTATPVGPGGTPYISVDLGGLTASVNVKVIATVKKKQGSASSAKTKSIVTTSVNSVSGSQDLNEVSLGVADIISLDKVYMKSGDFTTAPTSGDVDITSYYELDNGQRDNYYGIGKIKRKVDAPAPTGRLRIEFKYFSHGNNGNYFSVDSYSGVAYKDIPVYRSTESGGVYDLRDCLDFRPRIADDASGFTASGSSVTEIVAGDIVTADFSYYLNRIDKLFLDERANFRLLSGIPGLDPKAPEDPSDGSMVTHKLFNRAYGLTPNDVEIEILDNKNYTFREIGQMDARLRNVEYYTALTLQEKNVKDLEVKDENGLDRFKNGFIVESFNGHGIGDVQNPDYQCSIDMKTGEMRPIFVENNIGLLETLTSDPARLAQHYQKTGDLLTLPYTEVPMVSQLLATNSININPFAVLAFLGKITLTPPNDEWKDTQNAPDLIVNQEGNYDSIKEMVDGMGTIWKEWQDTWVGAPQVSEQVLSKTTEYAKVPMVHRTLDGKIDRSDPLFGVTNNRPDIYPWPSRTVTTTRTTTTQTGTRHLSGIRATVLPQTVTTNLGSKVINIAYIPWIRSRDVVFQGYGLKPNTKVYPFFDGVNVSGFCSSGSSFNAGNLVSTGTPLLTDATGKVTGTFRIPNSTALRFRTGQRIFRLTSSATNDATVSELTTSANATYSAQGLLETKQTTIVSTRNAEVSWEQVQDDVLITNTTISDSTNVGDWVDPIAQSFLVTKPGGCFVTSVDLFFETKDPNIPFSVQIRETVGDGRPGSRIVPFSEVFVDSSAVHTNVVTNGTLVIDGGAPIQNFTSSTLLKTTVTFPSPVRLEQGVSYALVLMSNSNLYRAWIATFGSDPNTGLVYNLVGTQTPIQSNPYAGVFFKSQNAQTWTDDQTVDLMFQLNCAEFDISLSGNVNFNNAAIPAVSLSTNPLYTTNGVAKVRVFHKNHGMPSGSTVTIAGATTSNGISAGNINGNRVIGDVEFDSYTFTAGGNANATGPTGGSGITVTENYQMDLMHPIVSHLNLPEATTQFYYKVTSGKSVHGTADQVPYVLGSNFIGFVANDDIEFDSPKLVASAINESTSMSSAKSLQIRAVLTSSNPNVSPAIDLSRISVVAVGNRLDSPAASGTNSINSTIDANTFLAATDTLFFLASGSKIVTSYEPSASILSKLQRGKYLTISGSAQAGNNNTFRIVSVSFSTPSVEIVVDGTLVNSYTTLGASPISTTNTSGTVVVAHTSHGYSTNDFVNIYGATTTNGITANNINGRRQITVVNANSYSFTAGNSNVANATSSGGGTEVLVQKGHSVTLVQQENYIDEKAPQHGSVSSKYICRRMNLANTSGALRISLAAYRDSSSIIEVYYKNSRVDDTTIFDNIPYELAVLDADQGPSVNKQDKREYTYTLNGLPEYTATAVKIVLRGTNTARPPRVSDFSAIALGT